MNVRNRETNPKKEEAGQEGTQESRVGRRKNENKLRPTCMKSP